MIFIQKSAIILYDGFNRNFTYYLAEVFWQAADNSLVRKKK